MANSVYNKRMSMSKLVNRQDIISSLSAQWKWYFVESKMARSRGLIEYANENRNIAKGIKLALATVRRMNGRII